MKISGQVPITALEEDERSGVLNIDADYLQVLNTEKDKIVSSDISIYNVNREFLKSLRIGDMIIVTVEVIEGGVNDTAED